jgi:hypothetical protein
MNTKHAGFVLMGTAALLAMAIVPSFFAPQNESQSWEEIYRRNTGERPDASPKPPVMRVDTQAKLELSRICRAFKNGDASYEGLNLRSTAMKDQLASSCNYTFR